MNYKPPSPYGKAAGPLHSQERGVEEGGGLGGLHRGSGLSDVESKKQRQKQDTQFSISMRADPASQFAISTRADPASSAEMTSFPKP